MGVTATKQTVSWPRKFFHACAISLAALVSASGLERTWLAVLAFCVAALGIGFDLLRLEVPRLNARVLRWLSSLFRRHERREVSSGTWFLVGAFLTVVVAPPKLAALAFLYLALGDPVASWVGVRFGRIRLPGGKSLEGSLALALVCSVAGCAYLVATATVPWPQAAVVAAGGAVVAAVAEWAPLPVVDDNLTVPVASAAALRCLAWALSLGPAVSA